MSDLEDLTRIYVEAFREPPWREVYSPNEVRSTFDEVLRWPETLFLIARDEKNRPIGAGIAFGAFRKKWLYAHLAERVHSTLFVSELFVDPAHRGRGACRGLVEGLFRRARETGFVEAAVGASVHQTAVRHLFVNRFGFREVAEEDYASPRALPDAPLPIRRVLMRGAIQPSGGL